MIKKVIVQQVYIDFC